MIGATWSSITEKNYAAIEAHKENTESRFMKRYKNIFKDDEHLAFDVVVQDEASKCLGKFGSCSVEYQDSDIHVEDGLKCIVISSSEPLVTDEISDALTDAGFGMVSFLPGVDPNDETKYLTKVVASASMKSLMIRKTRRKTSRNLLKTV